jgi:hypothetical protein
VLLFFSSRGTSRASHAVWLLVLLRLLVSLGGRLALTLRSSFSLNFYSFEEAGTERYPGHFDRRCALSVEPAADGVTNPADSVTDVFENLADLFHNLAGSIANGFADLLTDGCAVFSKDKAAYNAGVKR